MRLLALLFLCASTQAWRLRSDTAGLHDRQRLPRPFHLHGGLLARPHGFVHRPLHEIHDSLRAQARVYNSNDPSVVRMIEVPNCGKCPPGYGVLHDCSLTGPRARTVCHPCPAGDFSSKLPSHETCRPCSQCGQGLYAVHACNATSDTVCAACVEISTPINADYMSKCWLAERVDASTAKSDDWLDDDSAEDEAFYNWEDNDWQPEVSRQEHEVIGEDSASDEDRWAKALDRADTDEFGDAIDYAGYEYSEEDEYLSSEDIDGFATERRGDERVQELLQTDYDADDAYDAHLDDEYFFPRDFAEDMSAAEVDEMADDGRYTWGEARPFFRAASRSRAQFEAEREEAQRIHYRPSHISTNIGREAWSARVRNCFRRLMRHTRALGVALLALTASFMLATVLCWCRACRARRVRRNYGAVGVRNQLFVARQSLPRVHRRSPNDGSTVPYEKLNDVEREAIARSAAHIDAEEAVRGWPRRTEEDALLQQPPSGVMTVAESAPSEQSDAPRPEAV